ncbi:MAG: hypothetical protein AAGC57_17640 [Pseudomonadota bacterium]
MGADPKSSIKKALGAWDSCFRPEMDRINMWCNDYRNVNEKRIKDQIAKDMQGVINGRLASCTKKLTSDIDSALSDFKSLPPELKKEMDGAAKYLKAYPGGKSCMKIDASVSGMTLTIKPSLKK